MSRLKVNGIAGPSPGWRTPRPPPLAWPIRSAGRPGRWSPTRTTAARTRPSPRSARWPTSSRSARLGNPLNAGNCCGSPRRRKALSRETRCRRSSTWSGTRRCRRPGSSPWRVRRRCTSPRSPRPPPGSWRSCIPTPTYASGRIAIDARGNIWSSNNWLPGTKNPSLYVTVLNPVGQPTLGSPISGGGMKAEPGGPFTDISGDRNLCTTTSRPRGRHGSARSSSRAG